MASTKETMIEVTVKVNIKYDNQIKKAGEKLQIRESDLKEFKDKGYIEYIPQTAAQDPVPPQTPPGK
ncbi:hypothetical protein AB8U03_00090 [Clostridium sp. Mt-5]|uniref:DUF7210 domain-containing protein n=1 Tax=Clostridium moutaii TaxID=3240932 RepID=A0ABV4BIK7_9CLOT